MTVCMAKNVKASDPIIKSETQTFTSTNLTLYSDLALVDKIMCIDTECEKKTYTLLNLPMEMIDSSIFLTSKNEDTSFVEFNTETLGDNKKLSFEAVSTERGEKEIRLTYTTQNITWEPFYTAEFSPSCDLLSIEGWIDINNQTNTDFTDAHVTIYDEKSPLLQGLESDNGVYGQLSYVFEWPINLKKKSSKKLNWVSHIDLPAEKEYRLNVGGVFLEDQTNKNEVPPLELWISCINKGKKLPKGPLVLYKNNENGKKQILARMLSGETLTDGAISAAKELIFVP